MSSAEGYKSWLEASSGTVDTSVQLLLPYYKYSMDLLLTFGPWLAILGVGLVLVLAAFGLTQPSAVKDRLRALIVAGIMLMPVTQVQVSQDERTWIGLAPWVGWKLGGAIDNYWRSGIDAATEKMMGVGGLPTGLVTQLQLSQNDDFNSTELSAVLNAYLYECSGEVDLSKASLNTWRWHGLAGGGGLGAKHLNITREVKTWEKIVGWIPVVGPAVGVGNYASDNWIFSGRNREQIESETPTVLSILGRTQLDHSYTQNSAGFQVPGPNYWKKRASGEAITQDDFVRTEHRYWAYDDMVSEELDESRTHRFYAENCLELHDIADRAMAGYVEHVRQTHAGLAQNFGLTSASVDELQHSTGAAVASAMRSFYLNSAVAEKLRKGAQAPESTKRWWGQDEAEELAAEGGGVTYGVIHKVFEFVQEFNLDKGLPVAIGMMALGVGFIVCFFPFLVLVSLLVPGKATVLESAIKMLILFQLTIMICYAAAKVGVTLQQAANYTAAVGALNPLGPSTSVSNLVLAINALLLFFPILAGKVAFSLVYGDRGVSAPGADPARATHQAATTAGAALIAARGATALAGAGRFVAGGLSGAPLPKPNPPAVSSSFPAVTGAPSVGHSPVREAQFAGRMERGTGMAPSGRSGFPSNIFMNRGGPAASRMLALPPPSRPLPKPGGRLEDDK